MPSYSPSAANAAIASTCCARVAGSARTAAIPPAGIASTIDGTTLAVEFRALSRNSAVISGLSLGSTTMSDTPAALNQNGDTSRSESSRRSATGIDASRSSTAPTRRAGCPVSVAAAVTRGWRSTMPPTATATTTRASRASTTRVRRGGRTVGRVGGFARRRCGVGGRAGQPTRSEPRSARAMSAREPASVRPGAGVRVTTWGTPSVAHPAAKAEATPVGESSIATTCRVDAESVRRRAIRLGVGLAVRHLVAGDRGCERPAGAAAMTASASRRHDIVTSAQGTPAATHSASSRAAPGRHGSSRAAS